MARKHRPTRPRDHRGPRQDRQRQEASGLRKPGGQDQLEGRNPVLECLMRKRRRMITLFLDERARPHPKLDRLLQSAKDQNVQLRRVPRDDLDAISETGVHNGVIAWVAPLNPPSLSGLLDDLDARGVEPFIILVDEPQYEHNLGAVLRSALGAGVHAVVVPRVRGKDVNAVVQRVAMGAAEVVPVIREGISSCLALLARRAVRIVGAEHGGQDHWQVNLTGPVAIVIGGEDKGLTAPILKRCDDVATIPTAGDLQSLNLSVTAAVLMYERVRQISVSQ